MTLKSWATEVYHNSTGLRADAAREIERLCDREQDQERLVHELAVLRDMRTDYRWRHVFETALVKLDIERHLSVALGWPDVDL